MMDFESAQALRKHWPVRPFFERKIKRRAVTLGQLDGERALAVTGTAEREKKCSGTKPQCWISRRCDALTKPTSQFACVESSALGQKFFCRSETPGSNEPRPAARKAVLNPEAVKGAAVQASHR